MKLRELVRILERRLGMLDEAGSVCCGVSPAQCHATVKIGRSQDISLNEPTAILDLDSSTINRTVNNPVQ